MRKAVVLSALLGAVALAGGPISVSFERERLSTALLEIAERARMNIVADTSRSPLTGSEPRVTGDWKEAPPEEVLEDIAQSLGGVWGWHEKIVYFRQIPWIVTQGEQYDRNIWRALQRASWLARAIIMMRPEVLSTGRTVIPMSTFFPPLRSRIVSVAFALQPLTNPAIATSTQGQRSLSWREFNEATIKIERTPEGKTVAALIDRNKKRIAEWEVSRPFGVLPFDRWEREGTRSKTSPRLTQRGMAVDPLYQDKRLRKVIALKAKRVTISTLLKHLSEEGGVKLTASPQVRGKHVTFLVYRRPLYEAMRAISLAVDADWVEYGEGYLLVPITSQKERYRLMALSRGRSGERGLARASLSSATLRLKGALDQKQRERLMSEEGLPVSEIPFEARKALYNALKRTPSALIQPGSASLRSLYENGMLEITLGVDPYSGLPGGVMRLYPAGGQGAVLTVPFVLRPITTRPRPRP